VTRQALLQNLLERFGCPAVSLSEPFEDGLALLRVAEEHGLEGLRPNGCSKAHCREVCREATGDD
jgi:hypothetical protein